MKNYIPTIINEFAITGTLKTYQPFGNGHLHDTYKVQVQGGTTGREEVYIVQRINHFAFRNPVQLMENISRVTTHIRKKLSHLPPNELERRVLSIVSTKQGEQVFLDETGNYWRLFAFIPGSCSYDIILDQRLLFQAAYMLGDFLKMLADLPGPPLYDTIPDFHNGARRLQAFLDVVKVDACNRAQAARTEIDFVYQQAALLSLVSELVQQGEIPLRPTHNDTKVNNVLLDEHTGEGLCVIDLDTTMPGVSMYDFGDLARTTLSTRDEDETDLSTVFVEMPRFKTILQGFLAGAGDSLSETEKHYLLFSTKFMPLIIGLRFLTDFLQGDVYFKIHRQGHNLDRCKRQFKLVQSIIEKEAEMHDILNSTIQNGIIPPAVVLP